jgi:hypothetical protein
MNYRWYGVSFAKKVFLISKKAKGFHTALNTDVLGAPDQRLQQDARAPNTAPM